jgi:hypothetical protein
VSALLLKYKTYIAAAGLAGLALYQLTQGQFETAVTTLMGAAVAVGLRHETAPTAPR